jgi:hypothetical protein
MLIVVAMTMALPWMPEALQKSVLETMNSIQWRRRNKYKKLRSVLTDKKLIYSCRYTVGTYRARYKMKNHIVAPSAFARNWYLNPGR